MYVYITISCQNTLLLTGNIMDEVESLRKKIVALEKRANSLDKRYDKLIGKVDEFIPRTNAIMREGLPLEIFSRLSLINAEYDVFSIYPFDYYSREKGLIERSIDIYASKDSTYTVPEDGGRMAGQSWPERDHLLVEIKQRRKGVEWVFSTLPKSKKDYSIAGDEIPVANSGFELRPNENGLSSKGNPKDVNNAISQLNQSYMPFELGIHTKDTLELPGSMRQYASLNGKDHIWLLLITNAKLTYFTPPTKFDNLESESEPEEKFFKEVPWIVFRPEPSTALRYHQETLIRNADLSTLSADKVGFLDLIAKHSHEVHIINYDHLHEFLSLVKDPPRLKSIQFNLSVDDKHESNFTVEL